MTGKKEIMDIFDRKFLRLNRARAARKMRDHDFLFAHAMKSIADRLAIVKREFPRVLQIGARIDALIPGAVRIDLTEALKPSVAAQPDFLPFANGSFDLVVSAPDLHMVADIPGALLQIRRVLKPDGLFIGAMFGGDTLHQLRESMMQAEMEVRGGAAPRVIPFVDKRDAGALLQRAGFALPVVDSERFTVTYDSLPRLLRELRGMGESNPLKDRDRKPLTREVIARAAQIYAERFAESDGRLPATFEIIFMTGWAPHETQQKPLRPGTAQKSLAEALGTGEITTGDKATP
jgi:SAM-dependent methyltransferase